MSNIQQATPKEQPKYFYLLDIFRGLAALAVVLWHWQNFYSGKNGVFSDFDKTRQPVYAVLFVFYNSGLVAVDLFFLISGFVFFMLYAKKISAGEINPRSFFVLRFSRLYPLQFITLISVLFLQSIIHLATGGYFVYAYNNVYHFILNLFFATSWGIEKGPSFNGPNWSVSVEVLLYFLFFVLCWFKLNKRYVLYALLFIALIVQSVYSPIGRGLFSFFVGGLLYHGYLAIIKRQKAASYLKVFRILTFISIILIVIESKYSFCETSFLKLLTAVHFNHNNLFVVDKLFNMVIRAVIFPSFILYAVLLETVKGNRAKRFAFIGHISYSSYLLHFPLQLVIVYFCEKWGLKTYALFDSVYTLLGFFTILIIISLMSFYFFEVPVQNYLRRRFIGLKPKPIA